MRITNSVHFPALSAVVAALPRLNFVREKTFELPTSDRFDVPMNQGAVFS